MIRLILIHTVSGLLISSVSWAIPKEPAQCGLIVSGSTMLADRLSTSSDLPEVAKQNLIKLFNESRAFQDFITSYLAFVERAERDSSVLDWLSSGIPKSEEDFRNQISYLDEKWTERIAIKKRKLIVILEILSHAKTTDQFESTGLFTQSMNFQSPADASRSSQDTDTSYILDLLEFILGRIKSNQYGVDAILEDAEVIQEIMKVNRKFAPPEFQDGRSGLYTVP